MNALSGSSAARRIERPERLHEALANAVDDLDVLPLPPDDGGGIGP